jgi:hypothetical protein
MIQLIFNKAKMNKHFGLVFAFLEVMSKPIPITITTKPLIITKWLN